MLPNYTKTQRPLSRFHRQLLYALFAASWILLLVLTLVPLHDLEYYREIYNARNQNEYDNSSGGEECAVRKQPLVLVRNSSSVMIVFESTCGLTYKILIYYFIDGEKILVDDSFCKRERIDLTHYVFQTVYCTFKNFSSVPATFDVSSAGLTSGFEYHYQVYVADGNSTKEYVFTLPSENMESRSDSISLALLSDTHWGNLELRKQIEQLKRKRPQLFLHAGDMIQVSLTRFEIDLTISLEKL